MNSLTDTYEYMCEFRNALERFHDSLSASMADLNGNHEIVDPYWNGPHREKYDAEYGPLAEGLEKFLHKTCHDTRNFLDERIRLLEDFFESE